MDKHRIPLNQLLVLAKSSHGRLRTRILRQCMRQHGGLAWMMSCQFGKALESKEILSYMWQSLQTLPETWEATGFAATTNWKNATMELVRANEVKTTYVDCVSVTKHTRARLDKDLSGNARRHFAKPEYALNGGLE